MAIDNPQIEIEGYPAWRVYNNGISYVVEPWSGRPNQGQIGVTTRGCFVSLGEGEWRPTYSEGAQMLVAMLRMWLAAKTGWDNQRRILLGIIADIAALADDYPDCVGCREILSLTEGATSESE